jgi:signal transduction histidine kinase
MFKNLSTSTKLFVLCAAFVTSVGVPVYSLVLEKRTALDFTREELVGGRYLATVREIYATILATGARGERLDARRARGDAAVEALAAAEAAAGGKLQTSELARTLADALRRRLTDRVDGGGTDALVLSALEKARALAQRIGDDSNLALDPDLDSYYVQHIAVRLIPTLLGQLIQLQQSFETSVEPGASSTLGQVHVPILASLVRATAAEVESAMEAAYRGNPDGGLKRALGADIAPMLSALHSYLGVLSVAAHGIDTRDSAEYGRYHVAAVEASLGLWGETLSELDRLLRQRTDGLYRRMQLDLALIGAFASLSILVAFLTHRHIVGPLRRLEAVASAVRESKDYGLRADGTSRDEIGRVSAAFNDMLAELAAARDRETAERAEFVRVARLTTMGEMAASIAHEVNQPLTAIVASGNAGLRWLANETPDLGKLQTILQRVVRDGLRASEVVASIRAMYRRETQQRGPLNINDLITDVLGHLHGELQSERIAVEVELADGLPRVLADRVQVQQVLENLIGNGIEAMRSVVDRPRLLRLAASAAESNGVLIVVGDSGPGIDPKARSRIFDPFFTTKPDGMGLGLSICRSIIEAHGGRLSASPGCPHGTVFQFTLPTGEA